MGLTEAQEEKDALEMTARTARGVWEYVGADELEHMAHDLTDRWEMLEEGEAKKHYIEPE